MYICLFDEIIKLDFNWTMQLNALLIYKCIFDTKILVFFYVSLMNSYCNSSIGE